MTSTASCRSKRTTGPRAVTLGVVVLFMFAAALAWAPGAEAQCTAQIILVPDRGQGPPDDVLTETPPQDTVLITVSLLQTCTPLASVTGTTRVDLACATDSHLADPSGVGCNVAEQLNALHFRSCAPALAGVSCAGAFDSNGNPAIAAITYTDPCSSGPACLDLPINTTVQVATIVAGTVPGAEVVLPASGQFFITASTGGGSAGGGAAPLFYPEPAGFCGDGILNSGAGETCDGTAGAVGTGCRTDCTSCGDGVVQPGDGETCDGTAGAVGTGCRTDCTSCGDGVVQPGDGETCDPPGVGGCLPGCTTVPGHSISGHIWANTVGTPVFGAFISACPTPPNPMLCRLTSSLADGSYVFDNLPGSDWNLMVNPPGGSGLSGGTAGPITVSGSNVLDQDVILVGPTQLPSGASISTPSRGLQTSGTPTVFWQEPITLRVTGCLGGAGTAILLAQDGYSETVPLVESPPGIYAGTFAAPFPHHVTATISWSITCDTLTVTGHFDIYIDPSGIVQTTGGAPIGGATVTLFRSVDAGGPFVQVPDGSALMSPGNRNNPDVTTATGTFGWDVLAGYYVVRAEKGGCTAPGGSPSYVESAVLPIPPPITDLVLTLQCPAVCGDGIVEGAEECDDSNTGSGDGCSASCEVEAGYVCSGSPSVCDTVCGDGIVAGGESCDDGNSASGDGCSSTCQVEAGYQCFGSPSVCLPVGVSMDHFLCYQTKSTKGDLCTAEAPVNAGGTCQTEEDCGGVSGNEDTDATSFCVPNKFPKGLRVALADQLEPALRMFDVKKPVNLCAPADKNGEGIGDPATHLQGLQLALTKGRCAADAPVNPGLGCTMEADCGGSKATGYCVAQAKPVKHGNIAVVNQFHPLDAPLRVDATKSDRLLVPTAKSRTGPVDPPEPNQVDHYTCYKATVSVAGPKFTPIPAVAIEDQFTEGPRIFSLTKPTRLCMPVEMDGDAVKDASTVLLCYEARAVKGLCGSEAPSNAGEVCEKEQDCGGTKQTGFCQPQPKFQNVVGLFVNNEFGPGQVDATKESEFCVRSVMPVTD